MKKEIPDLIQLTIYGELFGGIYPDMTDETMITVQKGVYYSPKNEFYAFDLVYWSPGKRTYLNVLDMERILSDYGFFVAKPLFTGTFEECLNYPNTFQSTIPFCLGYDPPKNNEAEGIVIRPVKTLHFPSGRVMVKSKNPKFSERQKTKQTPIVEKNKSVISIWNALSEYVNENRLNNVRSKDSNLSGKQLIGPLAKDSLQEFIDSHEDRDLVDLYLSLTKKEKGLVTKYLADACQKLALV
jgi:Rnl2 family RNA ligase